MVEKKPHSGKAAPHKDKTPGKPREPATPGAQPAGPIEGGPSHAHQKPGQADRQRPRDAVDEESMESFPASDAPPHTRSTD